MVLRRGRTGRTDVAIGAITGGMAIAIPVAAIAIAAATALGGCATSGVRAAERGDTASLRAAILEKHARGTLTNREAAALAKAVIRHEIAAARGADAVARIRDARACAVDVDGAFRDRIATHDDAGAEAALIGVDDRDNGGADERAYAADPNDAWRAVAARAETREDDRAARLRAMRDPSPRVRRMAIRASHRAEEPADARELYEAARLDPEPMVRTEAVRAYAALAAHLPAGEVALRLGDLWDGTDDAIREDIAVAWTFPGVYERGGADRLRVLVASQASPGAIAGAAAVLRQRARMDAALVRSATALVARAIAEGSRRDRLHAVATAPLDVAPLADAMRAASKDPDPEVRVSALARLAAAREVPAAERAAATSALEGMAAPPAAEGAGGDDAAIAARARFVLAGAGDVRVQRWIEQDLTSKDVTTRLLAAEALGALGREARAAPLLVDADPSVRTRAACTIVVAARTR